MKNQKKSYLYAAITVTLWSTIASASKFTLGYLAPVELLFIASLVSCCLLFVFIIYQKKLGELKELKKDDWFVAVKFGFLNPFLYYLLLFKAYDILPAQQAQIINYTWAITLTLLSIPLLGHRVGKGQWLAILVSYCGVLVIATRGNIFSMHFVRPLGVCLALASTVVWALYWILNARDGRDPVIGLFANFLCALPFIACYLVVTRGVRPFVLPGVAGAVYIGFCEMGVAFILWLKAMKLTNNTAKIANMIFIAPFGSLVLIHFWLGEEIYFSTLVGLIFVVAGLVIQSACGDGK